MKRKQNKSKKALIVLSAAALLAVGVGVGIKSNGFQNWNVDTWFTGEVKDAAQKGNMVDDVKATGMQIKRLSSVTNQDGSIANTYSYSITPANATRKDMTISIAWNGQTEAVIGNFLTATIDSSAQTFTITKLADFATQAKVTIQSVSNEDVKAEILVDCKQVFNGFNDNLTQSLVQVLTAQAGVDIETISANGATAAGGNNLSSVYTIAIDDGGVEVSNPSATLHGYITGNATDAMVDSGLTIGNDWAVKLFDFADDFELSDLQGLISSDYAKMGEQNVQTFEGNAYFGVDYEINATLSRGAESVNVKVNMKAIASTANLEFGSVVTSIDPESSHIVFNDDEEDEVGGGGQGMEVEDPVTVKTFYLEQAAGDAANSEVVQSLQMTKVGDTDWYAQDYDIGYGQAFRVKIHAVTGANAVDTYSTEGFVWGNQNSGGRFVYYGGEGNVSWDNAIQTLGGGLYYVSK
ncbi:MAG: hypothetical protein K6E59_01925 [Bacilli bacterium]|nr:hypothetical protein [Bacilli bacterium]